MMWSAAISMDTGEVLAAIDIRVAGLVEPVASRVLFADLVRGIADQTRAAVAVVLAWMPCRDAGRFAMPLTANKPTAAIGIDRAGFGIDMAWRRAMSVVAHQVVAAVDIDRARPTELMAGFDTSATLDVAHQIATTTRIDMARAANLVTRIQANLLVRVAEESIATVGSRA